MMAGWAEREGTPYPLGVRAVADNQAYNFSLYSKHATAVTLHLFVETDLLEPSYSLVLDPSMHKSTGIWHCRLPASMVEQANYYAYTVNGPQGVAEGHRFDVDKMLLDPYACAVHFPPEHSRDRARDAGSNMGQAPLGVLPIGINDFDWGDDHCPRHEHDTVIYEMHVGGFTKRENSGVEPTRRGTFGGVVDKIPYLQALGVTVVELLPVFQFDPDEHNYWGYMTLNFFSPHHLYAELGEGYAAMDAFKSMVKALHQANIEVILDVVYNHTTESDNDGPNYSFRGIDNSTYYLLEEDRSQYRNDAGTGNVLHTANRYVRGFVLDSLRYWVKEMHVDGFRFDLASIFTRRTDGSVNLEDPPIIAAMRNDPVLADVRLIAEAWDITSYQLGDAFPGLSWMQWNGKFRDDVRGFIKSDPGLVNTLMTRIYGSNDLFPGDAFNAYHAYQSVNFVTAHDGFTLYDLVSYNQKRNQLNGHDNRDGTNDNRSWNCGHEGEDGVPGDVLQLRQRQMRNLYCLTLLANGTPMLLAGDEFAHTQYGNNNAYNQNNEQTWIDWDKQHTNANLLRFCQKMVAFRKAHPSLGRSRFWDEDVSWYGTQGAPDRSYHSHTLAFWLRGESLEDDDMYVMINAYWQPLQFEIQAMGLNPWKRVVDTSLLPPEDIMEAGEEIAIQGSSYLLEPRSIVVLLRQQ